MLSKNSKQEIIADFKKHGTDTGSTEVQVALLTRRIKELVTHLKKNKKDHASRRGLLLLVGQRKKLLEYFARKFPAKYKTLVEKLGL